MRLRPRSTPATSWRTPAAAARRIARLHRAYAGALANADAYADRLRADPLLSQLLHQVLSGITAVRSSAEILEDVTDLRRASAAGLSAPSPARPAACQRCRAQPDRPVRECEPGRAAGPPRRRELDDLIFEPQNYFPALEDVAADLRGEIDAWDRSARARSFGRSRAPLRRHRDCARQPRDRPRFPRPVPASIRAARTMWFQNTAPRRHASSS